jgi:hypothetical protein
MDLILKQTHVFMEKRSDKYSREYTQALGELYMNCVDRDGFFVPLDMAWMLAGFKRKADAKKCLQNPKLDLEEGLDWKIEPRKLVGDANGSTKQWGGNNYENIMMTSECFMCFCMAARTKEGNMLRRFVSRLVTGVKKLGREIAAGRIELRRVERGGDSETSEAKRLKVCTSQKLLMQEVMGREASSAVLCARINGETNKLVTGRYKGETAKLLGKKAKHVNARDYMTKTQLMAAEFAETMSMERLHENPDANAYDLHRGVLQCVTRGFEKELHGKIDREPKRLVDIRRKQALAQIADKPKVEQIKDEEPISMNTVIVPKKGRITNFFSVKQTT